jgi:hemoglobin
MSATLAEQLTHVSLYERLGGAAGIRRIVDGMVDAHLCNPVIAARFKPYLDDPDRVETIKQHICGFFQAQAGGAAPYKGRSMADAHSGMNIDEAEYMAAIDDALDTMRALGHAEDARDEVLVALYRVKDEILRT